MKNKISVSDLALFYGANAIITFDSPNSFQYYENIGHAKKIDGAMLIEYELGGFSVKPILRKTENMDDQERQEYLSLISPFDVLFLIRNHFDVFGWINQGIAIEKI